MTEAEIAARLVEALSRRAAEAAPNARLASASIEVLGSGDIAQVETRVERQTRTLLFLSGDAFSAERVRLASASSVHKISG